MGLDETGVSHHDPRRSPPNDAVYSDAEMARWIGGMYEAMDRLDLEHVIYWNSESGNNGKQAIINSAYGPFPQAVAALSGEITQAKQAAGVVVA
jgi:hypothetical protein